MSRKGQANLAAWNTSGGPALFGSCTQAIKVGEKPVLKLNVLMTPEHSPASRETSSNSARGNSRNFVVVA